MNPIDLDAIHLVEREKGISFESVMTALEQALAAAYKRSPIAAGDDARDEIDRKSGDVTVFAQEVEEDEETGELKLIKEWRSAKAAVLFPLLPPPPPNGHPFPSSRDAPRDHLLRDLCFCGR